MRSFTRMGRRFPPFMLLQASKVSIVLGVNGVPFQGHDPSSALAIGGQIIAAVEEERLCRAKRAHGLRPLDSAKEVLNLGGLQGEAVDLVASPWRPSAFGMSDVKAAIELRSWLRYVGIANWRHLGIRFVDHHVAHAWSGLAFVPNAIRGRRVGVLVLDGSGESTSGARYMFDGELSCRWQIAQNASVGIYYEALTEYLGFVWGDEGKTMGLAAYGRESQMELPKLPDDRMDGDLADRIVSGSPRDLHVAIRSGLVRRFRALYGDDLDFGARADIARAAQDLIKARIMTYVAECVADCEVLVVAGGVALNCTINASIAEYCADQGRVLVICPAASDTGVALGGAVAVSARSDGWSSVVDPYLGRGYEPEEIARELRSAGVRVNRANSSDLAERLLVRREICGWFEGRSEIGPRALGKRCIIARPDSVAIRDRVNMLKGRESWRPLAPSLTEEEFRRSFCSETSSPHMLINASARPDAHEWLEGVIHVDGTSRPQVVHQEGPYLELIRAMGAYGNAAAVLCTSFNAAGEPIVYTPTDALQSARAMGLDALAGDGWYASIRG
jgi:carbamoyltransferase